MNDRAALELLLEHGPLSRAQLGALTGLSKPTTSQLLARLERGGLVVKGGTREGLRGPSAQVYQVNPAAGYVAALDVTSARIDAVITDITGAVLAEQVLRTPRRPAVDVVDQVRESVDAAVKAAGLTRQRLNQVVIGTPGAVHPATGQLGYARHMPGWHRAGLLEEIRADLGVPVDIENDVNLAALAELWDGVAASHDDVVLMWVGEGIGLAILIAGELHRGASGGAGEVGYMPVPGVPLSRSVGRGGTGGFQMLAGAPAVVKLARDHGLRGGRDAATIIRHALDAGSRGQAFLTELANRLATGLATIVAVLDPELVVLTGPVGTAGGEVVRGLVETELHALALPRPQLVLGTVQGNAVRAGAVHAALTAARNAVFTTNSSSDESPIGPNSGGRQ